MIIPPDRGPKPPPARATRRLTRNQRIENRAFLTALAKTGNIRAAARDIGLKHTTMFSRRKHHAVFAAEWDAAIVVANARLRARGGATGPKGVARKGVGAPTDRPRPDPSVEGEGPEPGVANPLRTMGGEPVVVRRRDGKLQLRRAQVGKLTTQCEQAFLAALSATANVRLSAAAVGVATAAFHRRRRKDPGFAREMQMALEMGYERLELALLETMDPRAHADDEWRHNDPPPIPPMTPNQALQLLYLHRSTAKLWAQHPHIKRYPGEPREALSMRLSLLHEARMQRDRERFLAAEAAQQAQGRPPRFGMPALPLPDLAQVTGWSKASGKPPHHAGVALFGGWRLGDIAGKGKK